MSVSGIGSGNWSAYAAASADRTRGTATARADTGSSSDVDKVREKGLTAFAKQAKAEAWAEKVRKWRDEAMKAMGLTQERLDAMSPEDRAKAMQQIDEYVRRKIDEAMQAAREEAKRKGQPLAGRPFRNSWISAPRLEPGNAKRRRALIAGITKEASPCSRSPVSCSS